MTHPERCGPPTRRGVLGVGEGEGVGTVPAAFALRGLLAVVLAVLVARTGHAQKFVLNPPADTLSPPAEAAPETPPETPWEPRAPGEVPAAALRDDWVRLRSGEWLRGSFDRLENDKLSFDSEELDDLELDWEDVESVHCRGIMTCLFDHVDPVTGRLVVRDQRVILTTGDKVLEFDRADLLTVIRGLPTERNFWSADVTLGFTARSGNTDQVEYSARARAERTTPLTRTVFEYRGALGRVQGEENVNNHRGDARLDLRQTRRFFWTPAQVQALRDEFQNIDLRGSLGAGVGYHWLDTSSTDLEVAGGVQYRYTEFGSVEPDEDRREGTAALYGRLFFDHELTSAVDFETAYEAVLAVPDTNDWTHSLRTTLEIDLPRSLELDITGIWDRNNAPARDGDGELPEKDDFTITVGIGWEF